VSGLSTGDYKARIRAVAEKVRFVLFGEKCKTVYLFKSGTTIQELFLPPVDGENFR